LSYNPFDRLDAMSRGDALRTLRDTNRSAEPLRERTGLVARLLRRLRSRSARRGDTDA